ncbi:MAG: Unknown protein [uncultured Sulfurovum sp.]|uniref:Uncharacterized protein n=1 Tax=uncultured Sulfurovum sp. TaxID=269237 RepID=A0A6S6SPG0_9BACT|nr:MAG: Unknown protein [uncultured Sulfurovum sp.]
MKKNRVKKLEEEATKNNHDSVPPMCFVYKPKTCNPICTCGLESKLEAIRKSGRQPTLAELYPNGILG